MNNIKNKGIYKTFFGILLAGAYFVLEPMLSHVYILYAFGFVNKPYTLLKAVLPIAVFGLFLFRIIKTKGRINYGALLPMAFLFICYLPGCIIAGSVSVWLETVIPVLALCIFIMPVCYEKNCGNLFVTAIADLYLVLAIVNLIFKLKPELFLNVGAWQEESFIAGIENMSSFPLLMGAFFAVLDAYLNEKRIKAIIYLFIFLASTYIMWTAAAVVCAAVLLLWLIPPIRNVADKVSLKIWALIAFTLFAVLMWCWKPIMNWEPVRFIMEDVLKKDVTLTGRLDIWNGVLQMFYKKPIFGHGLLDNAQNLYFDTGYNHYMVHAHSAFLQTLYEGGVLTLLAVLAVLVYTSSKIKNIGNRRLTGIFSFFIFLFLINLEVDQFMMYPWRSGCWCMICFLSNYAVIIDGGNGGE